MDLEWRNLRLGHVSKQPRLNNGVLERLIGFVADYSALSSEKAAKPHKASFSGKAVVTGEGPIFLFLSTPATPDVNPGLNSLS